MKKITDSTPFRVLALLTLIFGIYLVFVVIWSATSPNYQPVKPVDHVVRQAPEVEDWNDSRGLHTRFD